MNNNEVKIVNGAVVGIHLGTPMQDAIAEKPEDNEAYATERNTVTRVPNGEETWDDQPAPSGGGGASGGTKFETVDITFTTDGGTYILLCPIADKNGDVVSLREKVEVGKTYYFPKSSSDGTATITVATFGSDGDGESLMCCADSNTDSIEMKYVDCGGMAAVVSVANNGSISLYSEAW